MNPGKDLYVRSTDLLEAQVANELVALDSQAGNCFGFNEIATIVWQELETPRTLAQLQRLLCERFEVDAQTCADDVGGLLDQLVAWGLVRRDPGAAADESGPGRRHSRSD